MSKHWHLERQDNDDLANKFVESLNSAGVSCKKNGNKVSISYIN